MSNNEYRSLSPRREKLHEVIFETDTKAGKLFDVILLAVILISVIIVLLESVPEYHAKYASLFSALEWVFTIFFTIEYGLRLYCVHKPIKYATSAFGIIDLLAIIPTYLSLFVAGSASLMVIRGLRLLRVFRIFKLASLLVEGEVMVESLKASRAKITVFVSFILVFVCIFGSVMYLVEGNTNEDFDNIPRSMYWAIVTLTTVGYGDIAPQTAFGQFLASIIMLLGYAIIAVPTGIVTAEFLVKSKKKKKKDINTQSCMSCTFESHDFDALFCKKCGYELHPHLRDNLEIVPKKK